MKYILILLILLISSKSQSQQISKIGNGVNPIAVHSYAWNDSIIIRGNFNSLPDNTPSEGMAYWNGTIWKDLSLNTYSDGRVFIDYQGSLLMGGSLTMKSNFTTLPLLKLNGKTWENVYGVTSANSMGSINDMIVYKNELYVAGKLQRIGGTYVNNIAKWDGVSWSNVAGGCGAGVNEVSSLAILNNELYVAGFFSNAGNTTANQIAKWDGTTWSTLDSGVHQGGVSKIIVYKNDLVVIGGFTKAGSYNNLSNVYRGRAYWDGTSWNKLSGFAEIAYEYTFQVYRGELFMGTYMNSKTHTINDTVMMSWDGSNYTKRLGADAEIIDVSIVNDKLIIIGDFDNILNKPISKIASYYLDPVGIKQTNKKGSVFKVYPNPSNSYITISTSSNYKNVKIIIRNEMMEIQKDLQEDFAKNDCSISIGDLRSGLYFIQFYVDDNLVDTQKYLVN